MQSRIDFGKPEFSATAIVAIAPHDDEPETMCCPVCQCEFVHLIGCGVLDNEKVVLQSGDGWHVAPYSSDRRGSVVVTIFRCEQQCVFVEHRTFTKGQVTTTYRAFTGEGIDEMVELWRD